MADAVHTVAWVPDVLCARVGAWRAAVYQRRWLKDDAKEGARRRPTAVKKKRRVNKALAELVAGRFQQLHIRSVGTGVATTNLTLI